MHPAPTTPLGQAIAAIIAMLIAALAEHAAEHPMLAPGCRASIRQLEKLARQLDAMVAEWEATRHTPPPHRRKAKHAMPSRQHTRRLSACARRLGVLPPHRASALCNRLPAARAPPASWSASA